MFEKLTLTDLRKIVKDYNLKTTIKGFSTLKKSALIAKIKEHMKYENNVLKRLNDDYKFDLKDLGERKKRGRKKGPPLKIFSGTEGTLPDGTRTKNYNTYAKAWIDKGYKVVKIRN